MRIAFVHDRLYYIAGAEQVFFDIIREKLPVTSYQLPVTAMNEEQGTGNREQGTAIFTMFSDKKELIIDNQTIQIISALPRWVFAIFVYFDKHKTPFFSRLLDYRNLMFFYPLLIWILKLKIKVYKPKQVVISSFAVAKNAASYQLPATSPSNENKAGSWELGAGSVTLHAQSPFMYIHNHYQSNLHKLKFPIKQFYQLAHRYLSPRDLKHRHYDTITANSHYTAGLLQQIYDFKDIVVQYPKLNSLFSTYSVHETRSDLPGQRPGYFIFVGRLVTFSKQVDIIIKAFNQTGDKLKIIGSGPDEAYLKSIAHPNIEFLGWISDPEVRCEIIGKAKGLVNITLESFGYVTAESLCLGTPVLGYNKGATPELVTSYQLPVTCGILIEEQTVKKLIEALHEFQTQTWEYEAIAQQARSRFEFSDLKFQLR